MVTPGFPLSLINHLLLPMKSVYTFIFTCISSLALAQDPFQPDPGKAPDIKGMKLVWQDEFNQNGPPDPSRWKFEKGFVRNRELQWYQPDNAVCKDGVLRIEARKVHQPNPLYKAGSEDWKTSREFIEYTSSSLKTEGLHDWKFGRFEIRAKIDTSKGSWPAIWTLGVSKEWPSNGEIDIMEFYRVNDIPTILANVAWGTGKRYTARWDEAKVPFRHFLEKDKTWPARFHTWRMDWDEKAIRLYLDDELLNETLLSEASNPDGFAPFHQPHYVLLNLAIGGNGGDPSGSHTPIVYEVDYIRIYQQL